LNARKILQPFYRKEYTKAIAKKIHKLAKELKQTGLDEIKIMHVCGTHEHTITYYGIRYQLPEMINLIAGPGCPVCVVPAREIDEAIKLSEEDIEILTYGDMYKVPGTSKSLAKAKTEGAKVGIVYGFLDAINIALKNPNNKYVFFAVGFETTAPTVASHVVEGTIPENLSLLVSYRITVPIVKYVFARKKHNLKGVIAPGHVSAITGSLAWKFIEEKHGIPVVVAGFEPLDVLYAIYKILESLKKGTPQLINEYSRVVKPEGNLIAKRYIAEAFDTVDGAWRGIGIIPESAWILKDKFRQLDARKVYDIEIPKSVDTRPGCLCAEVVLGEAIPTDCPLFMTACTPENPYGPCMVSSEGTCSIWARYGGREPLKK